MDKTFKRLLAKHTPPLNDKVMNGLACFYMREQITVNRRIMSRTESYIDAILRNAAKSYPPGFEYVDFYRCTPQEEYYVATKSKDGKRTYDLARSDIYLVKYQFSYNGQLIKPHYVYLPAPGDAGLIHLGGGCYHISPVLTDKVISPGERAVFVRLLRDRISFERCPYEIVIDGEQKLSQIAWAPIYRRDQKSSKVPPTTKAHTTALHYLLGKYGFTETFRKYLGVVPVVGHTEITPETYPEDHWVICHSKYERTSNSKPRTYIDPIYQPTTIRLAFPRSAWMQNENLFMSYATAFFYIVDHFPSRIQAKYVDNLDLWQVLLGTIIWSGHFGVGKLHAQTTEHYASLDEYLDALIVIKLSELGYQVNDFYDLLALIIQNINTWIIDSSDAGVSLFNKSVEVLYYALFDITKGIFKAIFKLNRAASRPKPLTVAEIEKILNINMKTRAVFRLTNENLAVSTVADAGDHKYPKITSVLVPQQQISGAKRRRHRGLADSSRRIHTSHAEAGSYAFLSKGNPTPSARVNMWLKLDLNTGNVLPKDEFKPLRDNADRYLALDEIQAGEEIDDIDED